MTPEEHFDVCIIGAGVIGLAAAWKITTDPAFKHQSVLLLEQNKQFGQETSSRNSEVIHAGIYYPENSLKARLCVSGKEQLYGFCQSHNIPCRKTGKLIVGNAGQLEGLEKIHAQAKRNGVENLEMLDQRKLAQLEPALTSTLALLSPSSGIIDSHAYMQSLLHQAENKGVLFAPLTRTLSIEKHARGLLVHTVSQEENFAFTCSSLVNAAGLHAQSVAQSVMDFPAALIPEQVLVKGSYFTLQGASPFSHLIYPVPEPDLKGLGIHVTLDMSGQTRFGPDAEAVSTLDYGMDDSKKAAFREAISRYFPAIRDAEIHPAYTGIRPKLKTAQAIADFEIQDGAAAGYPGLVQLFGIESPGLTASLAIADEVVRLMKNN